MPHIRSLTHLFLTVKYTYISLYNRACWKGLTTMLWSHGDMVMHMCATKLSHNCLSFVCSTTAKTNDASPSGGHQNNISVKMPLKFTNIRQTRYLEISRNVYITPWHSIVCVSCRTHSAWIQPTAYLNRTIHCLCNFVEIGMLQKSCPNIFITQQNMLCSEGFLHH